MIINIIEYMHVLYVNESLIFLVNWQKSQSSLKGDKSTVQWT